MPSRAFAFLSSSFLFHSSDPYSCKLAILLHVTLITYQVCPHDPHMLIFSTPNFPTLEAPLFTGLTCPLPLLALPAFNPYHLSNLPACASVPLPPPTLQFILLLQHGVAPIHMLGLDPAVGYHTLTQIAGSFSCVPHMPGVIIILALCGELLARAIVGLYNLF